MIGSFSSCRISALLVLSHFSWQLVGPIQYITYTRRNELRWLDIPECIQFRISVTVSLSEWFGTTVLHRTVHPSYTVQKTEPKKNETAVNFVKPKPKRKLRVFLQNWTKVIFCQPHTLIVQFQTILDFHICFCHPKWYILVAAVCAVK